MNRPNTLPREMPHIMLIETAFDCHFEVLSLLDITEVKELYQLLPFPGHHDSALYCITKPYMRSNPF